MKKVLASILILLMLLSAVPIAAEASATYNPFSDVAAGAGFPDTLTAALEGKKGYEIRFFLLDWLGKWECQFHKG